MKKFSVNLLVFSAITGVLVYFALPFIPSQFVFPHIGFLFVFFIVSTLLIHYGMIAAAEKSPKQFITYFLLITTIKMFVYMCFIIVYALFNRDNAMSFILAFLVFYLVYTIFEIVSLLKFLK